MFHPVVRLTAWFAAVVGFQSASTPLLFWVTGAALVAGRIVAPDQFPRLLRRSRWLFFGIAVLFAWATSGTYVFPSIEWLSPTVEGLGQAVEQLARLASIVALVAILAERSTLAELVSALHALLAPVGSARDRIAVRLMLVLDLVDSAPGRGWRDWLAPEQADIGPTCFVLDRTPVTATDYAAVALIIAASGSLTLL